MILSTEAPRSHCSFTVHLWGLRALTPRGRELVNAGTKLQSQTGWTSISPLSVSPKSIFQPRARAEHKSGLLYSGNYFFKTAELGSHNVAQAGPDV